ncbi:aminoglycoside phosphotransferase [Agaricicola taiwanensis]|uniref:Aminoglycoside phosphotransferase n=1 Tax=Agaricicola taiwanensis TaxID=591372 RepID=A0A8J2YBR9_9RHOB|nr:phosphotransferase family protein [Agaricicola taiwanensis]GGE34276.1 aminoglycoside phosphotransferase [Agaricicola taiwanensis]
MTVAAREIPQANQFRVQRLEVFLTHTIAGFRGPVTVRPIHDGLENMSYLIATPGDRLVLRAKTPDATHPLEREFRVVAALSARGFPVPRPLIYSDDESVLGYAFYVMTFVDGRIFPRPSLPGVTPADRTAIYDAMTDTLARLHSYDPHTLGLASLNKSSGYLAGQVQHWSEVYRTLSGDELPEMNRLMAWLPDHLPPDRPLRLVHNDFATEKLIIAPQEPKILAVVDWEAATLGDPVADAVNSAIPWITPHATASGTSLMGLKLSELGIPSMDRYLSAYAARAGLAEIPHLNTYIAYCFFRRVAMLRRNPGAAEPRHAAALAKIGWAFAQRAG